MATLLNLQSRRMYSWWWDSHISPKNSKWLQDNLTDMDSKVKQMIKLIEEDADSFARRAEMYYKQRPELMKMVEEFYRAYRALAERYDHATGVIRQAHRTMTEAFPNQVSVGDDSPVSSAPSEGDPHTPEMPHPARAMFDPDELHNDALGLSPSNFHAIQKSGPAEGRVKKSLNFSIFEEKEKRSVNNGENHNNKSRVLSESERDSKYEREIVILKEAISKLEAEKEASLHQYQGSLEKLSNLQTQVVRAQENSILLNERASKAEADAQEVLTKLEAEREASLLQHPKCADTISSLEKNITLAKENSVELSERASKADTESQTLKADLTKVNAEREAILHQYQLCLSTISNLKKTITLAQENAVEFSERASKAETETETLKENLTKLEAEREAGLLQYQQCLNTISNLEKNITLVQENAVELSEQASKAKNESQALKHSLSMLEAEKESIVAHNKELLMKLSVTEKKLLQVEDDTIKISDRASKAEADAQSLKENLTKVEAEREVSVQQYQQCLSTISDLEKTITLAQENAVELSAKASKAETESQTLKTDLTKVKAERDASLHQYHQCLNIISNLEKNITVANENAFELNKRANIIETEIQDVKHALSMVESEKEAIRVHNNQLLAKLSDTEKKLLQAEEDTKNATQQANKAEREAEREVETHNQALAKLINEKEEASLKYQQCLETIFNMEHRLSCAQDIAIELSARATKAETESHTLNEDLTKVKSEREASLHQYHQCLDKISNLKKSIAITQENAVELNERASIAETEAQAVKHVLCLLEAEKEAVLGHNSQLLMKLSDTEKKLMQAEEDTQKITEQADNAESEVESLKQALTKLTNEKEEEALKYQQCLETVCNLERELSCAQEDAQRLNIEVCDGVLIIKGVEERCLHLETSNQSLQFELTSLEQQIETQNQELAEKQQEVGMLQTCIQEKLTQFKEIELALQALQSQSQEELRSLTMELEKRAQVIKDLQLLNYGLQDEVQMAKKENKSLNELNMSSALSIKTMQEELAILKEVTEKLQNEAKLSMDQKSALQQEIYRLNEEINDLDKKHQAVLEQVELVGMNSECFGPAVKELQDENSKLNELYEKERIEKLDIFEKLAIMDERLEKNAVLENSISDLNVELEAMREKVREFEDKYHFFLAENSVLVLEKNTILSQLQLTTENSGKLSEKNTFLENSLFEKNAELEGLEKKLKSSDVSCQLLDTEKSVLITENENLASELQISQRTLENLEKILTELEEKYKSLEQEKESSLCQVEEFQVLLDVLNQEHNNVNQLSANRVADLESQLCFLQEESRQRKKELEIQQDEAFIAQTEIFNLKKCVKDVDDENFSLLERCQKLFETSELSKKLISELEHDKLKQLVEVKSLNDEINNMKTRVYQVVKALDFDMDHSHEDKFVRYHTYMDHILRKFEDQRGSLSKSLDVNQQLILENMILCTLFGQLMLDATNLETEKNTYDHELKIRSGEVLALLSAKQSLQVENYAISGEAISLNYLSLIFKNTVIEKFMELNIINEKVKGIENDLKISGMENHQLKESLDKSQNELETARNISDQLKNEVASKKELFHLKEMELLQTERKLQTLQVQQMELQNLMEGLSRKFDEVNEIKVDQEKHIHHLSEENGAQIKEGEHLRNMVQIFEVKLLTLQEEHEETKVRETTLSSQLEKWRTVAELWETEGTKFFNEMQASSIHGVLFMAKIHELSEACQILEDKSTSNVMEIEFLKERVDTLEGKNGWLEAQLGLCTLGIDSLDHSIASLENFILQDLEVNKNDTEKEVKDDKLENHLQVEISEELNENLNVNMPINFLSLPGLETRIKAIEKDLIERERLAVHENLNMKKESNADDHNQLKLAHEISETGRETLPKDIMLDQVSECSSYGISKREILEADSPMLKLWETTDQNGSIVKKDDRRKKRSSEILDKLEISKRFVDDPLPDGNKKSILERLDSDLQKLSVLQVVVEDLKRKVEITEKRKNGKGLEYDTVRDQLEESEEAITKLFDLNKKLTNTVKEEALTSKEKSDADSEQSGTIRNIVTEQARRGSENIGRLQLEVQKLQFLLLKFDDEKQSKGKTRNKVGRKTRVILHDYLYGGILRSSYKGKKGSFCACIRPSTRGD